MGPTAERPLGFLSSRGAGEGGHRGQGEGTGSRPLSDVTAPSFALQRGASLDRPGNRARPVGPLRWGPGRRDGGGAGLKEGQRGGSPATAERAPSWRCSQV